MGRLLFRSSVIGLAATLVMACGTCAPASQPEIVDFFAMPQSIEPGETAKLFWSVAAAESVEIDQGIGMVSASGSMEVSPSTSTDYTLTARSTAGVAKRTIRVDLKTLPSGSEVAAAAPTDLRHPTFAEAVDALSQHVSDTALAMTRSASDAGVMQGLAGKLRNQGIQAGFVRIECAVRAEGALDACVAVATRDNGVALFTVIPSDIDVQPPEERLQVVYLQEGSRIGLMAATVAKSTDYAWYTEFVDEVYEHYDYLEWLAAFAESVADYSSHLDRLIAYVENPPTLSGYFSDSQLAELDRLIDGANANIDQFNAVAEELNELVDALEELPDIYPSNVYYVETIWTNPLRPLPTLPPIPQYGITVVRTPEEYLTELRRRVYTMPPTAPNRDDHKCDRVSDKNFVVTDYEIQW